MSLNWKDLAKDIGASAPILGTLIGGPAGAAIGTMVSSALGCANTPDDVKVALATNPDAAVKLAQIASDSKTQLQTLLVQSEANRLAADTAAINSVNTTMQAEDKADHWPTYSWRPFCGFVFGVMFGGVYFVLPLAHIPVPVVPTEAWLAMGGILGVASFFRGKAQAAPDVATDPRG
jgi:hypothetical protein